MFGHLEPNVVIKYIINEYSVKPEQWEMRDEGFDETWIAVDVLRETEIVRNV